MSTLHAVYDLQTWQPTYCIPVFLAAAEYERIKRGCDDMVIDLLPGHEMGMFGKFKHWPNTPEELETTMNNIVLPACRLLPSAVQVNWPADRARVTKDTFSLGDKFVMKPYSDAWFAGVRPLRVKDPWPYDPKLVTITLRECGDRHWAARDSNLPEWLTAAKHIQRAGYKVIFVRDTRLAHVPLKNYETMPEASVHVDVRAHLYQSAAVNLFVANGPVWLCFLLDVPTILFKPFTNGTHRNASLAAMESFGFTKDAPLPGVPDYQRFVWQPDVAGVIVEETLKYLHA